MSFTLSLRYLLVVAAVGVLFARCDMPTEAPSFSFDAKVKAPLFLESSYQLLGSSASPSQVFIDTTNGSIDTLFQTTGASNKVNLTQEISGFELGSLDGAIPEVSLEPFSFAVAGGEMQQTGTAAGGKQAVLPGVNISNSFSIEDTLALNIDNVSFTDESEHIDLKAGELVISRLVNGFDIGFKVVTITFPNIRAAPYGQDDALRLTFTGSAPAPDPHRFPKLKANSTRQNIRVALEGYRLIPTNNQLAYTISGETEEYTGTETIQDEDEIRGDMIAEGLSIKQLTATVSSIEVDVTKDVDGDGRLELSNNDEAQVIPLEGLGRLSEQLKGLQVRGSELRLQLKTNLPASAEIYAAIAGTNDSGNTVYLTGQKDYAVQGSELQATTFSGKSGTLSETELVKLPVPEAADPTGDKSRVVSIVLNADNSTVDAFLSNLPREIRLVATARLNPGQPRKTTLQPPLQLNSSLHAQIPLTLAGESFTVQDTVAADFAGLQEDPKADQPLEFQKGELRITYENGWPIGADLQLKVVDANYQPIGISFGGTQKPLDVEPAHLEEGTQKNSAKGTLQLGLTEDQLDVLGQGRHIIYEVAVRTDEGQTVALRADDTISLALRGEFTMRINAQ